MDQPSLVLTTAHHTVRTGTIPHFKLEYNLGMDTIEKKKRFETN